MEPLITQIKTNPQYESLLWAIEEPFVIDAICGLLPDGCKLLSFILPVGDTDIRDIQDDVDFTNFEDTEYCMDYSTGFKIEFPENEYIIGIWPDTAERIKNLNYSFGRYIKPGFEDWDTTQDNHWSLDIDMVQDPTNSRIFYISFYSDDSTY